MVVFLEELALGTQASTLNLGGAGGIASYSIKLDGFMAWSFFTETPESIFLMLPYTMHFIVCVH